MYNQSMKVYMGYTIFFITLIIAYVRIYYGIDFTDEGYNIAMPYLFTKGQTPFVDEILAHQGGSLLIQPFLSVYLKIVGDTDGIVLFSRHLFFAFSATSSLALFLIIKRFYNTASAVFATVVHLLYVPFSLYCLHYNYLGSTFFLLFLLLITLSNYTFLISLLIAVCAGLSCLTYPTFAVPIFIAYVYCFFRRDRSSKEKAILLATTVAMASVFFISIASYGFKNIVNVFEVARSANIWGGEDKKFLLLISQIRSYIEPLTGTIKYFYILAVLFLVHFFLIKKKLLKLNLLLTLIIGITFFYFYFYYKYRRDTFYISLIFPLLLLTLLTNLATHFINNNHKAYRRSQVLNAIMILISTIAGVITAYTSANGLPNFGVGGYAALFIGVITVFFRLTENKKWPSALFFSSSIIIPLFVFGPLIAYRDVTPLNMNATIQSGPFYGLKTSVEKKKLLELIQNTLDHFRSDSKTVLFYDFPAGYLMLENPPRTNSTWLLDKITFPIDQTIYTQYLLNKGLPDIVFMFKWDIFNSQDPHHEKAYDNNTLYLFFKNAYSKKQSPAPWLDIFYR